MKSLLLLTLVLLLAAPVAAQYEDDEQTRDYEEQDRRYQERGQDPEQSGQPGEQTLEVFLVRCEKLIRDKNHRSASSEHYRVQTDDPRLDAEATAALLEKFRAYFDDFWSGRIELRVYDATSRVFLFYSFHKFNQVLAGDFRFDEIRPKGHYGSLFDVITLHSDAGGVGGLSDALVHEAAHQLIDRRIFGGDSKRPSIWVSEGLASYFGYTYLDAKGRFRSGLIGGKSVALIRDGPTNPGEEAQDRLRAFRKALESAKRDESGLIERVVSMDRPDRFYGTEPLTNYGASWVLVHFLFHGEEGRYAAPFVRYLELEAQGQGGPRALYRELGAGPGELQAAIGAYVKKLKPR